MTWAARSTDPEVLNRAEVASLLAVDPRTVDNAIEDGTLPPVGRGRRASSRAARALEVFGCPGRAVRPGPVTHSPPPTWNPHEARQRSP